MTRPNWKTTHDREAVYVYVRVACSYCKRETKVLCDTCGMCSTCHEVWDDDRMLTGAERRAIESREAAANALRLSLLPVGSDGPKDRTDPPIEFRVIEIGKAKKRSAK